MSEIAFTERDIDLILTQLRTTIARLEKENESLKKELTTTQAKLRVSEANLATTMRKLFDPKGLIDVTNTE